MRVVLVVLAVIAGSPESVQGGLLPAAWPIRRRRMGCAGRASQPRAYEAAGARQEIVSRHQFQRNIPKTLGVRRVDGIRGNSPAEVCRASEDNCRLVAILEVAAADSI
jgi:hypothetical protein